ncbi:MAG: hypothetical protein KJN89_10390 [Gammaproteobacteria bacterium]|nr:hypothetical protein [Gammaproteobacteria bacterium]NNJ50775.1 hypothetical protein [Gammaproteobacteria bacterium]
MTELWSKEKIKGFVRNTLGCGCPDKVFKKIDISEQPVESDELQIGRIVVGDVLLIYIISPGPSAALGDSVEAIALSGKNDRDRNGYNRFRLVVSGIEDDARKERVSACFSKSFIMDEKMHIHFVNQQLVDALRESG